MSSSSTTGQPGQFGPNEWLVEEMYQRFLDDPSTVDPAWHDFFADYRPDDGDAPPPAPTEQATPARSGGDGRADSATTPTPDARSTDTTAAEVAYSSASMTTTAPGPPSQVCSELVAFRPSLSSP